MQHRARRFLLTLLLLAISLYGLFLGAPQLVRAAEPSSVTIAGSFQSELGCTDAGNPADWIPSCNITFLTLNTEDNYWRGTFNIPTGNWEYKAALNGNWSVSYPGSNVTLSLGADTQVRFYYSSAGNVVLDSVNDTIATLAGSFQSELGCTSGASGDWTPECLRSRLVESPSDPNIFTFFTAGLQAGNYEVKVAINESWSENYGVGGAPNGANIPFTVPSNGAPMLFTWNKTTKVLDISSTEQQPTSVTIVGSFQSDIGCTDAGNPADWIPSCNITNLTFDPVDRIWQGTFNIPSGNWEYKATLNGTWAVSYPNNNIGLNLAAAQGVKFYFNSATNYVQDNVGKRVVTAAGSFQSELGCTDAGNPADWQPSCLRSMLEDPDGDGIYEFVTTAIPQGSYEWKAALNEDWAESYGSGGGGDNIVFDVPRNGAVMTFRFDSNTNIPTVSVGGVSGNIKLAKAFWVTEDTIAWSIPNAASNTVTLHYAPTGGLTIDSAGVIGGTDITLTYDPAGLSQEVKDKFPHIASYSAFKLPANELANVPEILEGQLAVSAKTGGGDVIDATALQIPGVLDDLFTYDGQLGVIWNGAIPTLRVWAPTAKSVKLHLFDTSTGAATSITNMVEDPVNGTWTITGDATWKNKFYLYEVEVFVRGTGRVEINFVPDPYSISTALGSKRSQIVDLNDSSLKPAGWDSQPKPALNAFEDIVLYELHIRDFSIFDETVPANYRGKYMAFTVSNSDGMTHLRTLADAGVTHVHLLPTFDIATVNEDEGALQEPDYGQLLGLPPDSDDQQELLNPIRDQDGFNWGYDPLLYGLPEGSYSTDPDGSLRILEFRRMVQALNNAGLRVVMDIVYNHTTSSGQNANSVLDRVVPGYYHRYNLEGNIERSTCCDNTATEHNMMEKLMIDTMIIWSVDYKVDGYRYDLMGHHMRRNIEKVQQVLNSLNIAQHGVDGSKIYIYGEAWNFGEVANNQRGINAIQSNMAGTGIGSFNDRLRDAVRGGGPFDDPRYQGFATGLFYDSNGDLGVNGDQNELLRRTDWVRVGLAATLRAFTFQDRFGNTVEAWQVDYQGQQAGYTLDPQEVINYVSAHDNDTLFDGIQLKAPDGTSMADRIRMNTMSGSLIMLAQGVPFMHAGDEILRSKSLDRNSYNSGDWFNEIDFSLQTTAWGRGLPPQQDNGSSWGIYQPLLADPTLKPTTADMQESLDQYLEFIRIRKSTVLFRLRTGADVISRVQFWNTGPSQKPGLIVMSIADEIRPGGSPIPTNLPDLDPSVRLVVVVFNPNDEAQTFTSTGFADIPLSLHPIQQNSVDEVVRTSTFNQATGTFSVPGRTTAVFVDGTITAAGAAGGAASVLGTGTGGGLPDILPATGFAPESADPANDTQHNPVPLAIAAVALALVIGVAVRMRKAA